MMKIKKWKILIVLVIAVLIAAAAMLNLKQKPPAESLKEIQPSIGDIRPVITSTAIVQPQNRLEIKPPINGRIDEILVHEGDTVKIGQVLARMSSTERAALLDAARARGPDEVKYWEDVYRPTPLLSPIDGEVIVSTDEPGQTITAADVIVVLSDYLIVQAQVDETDVGRVKIGQSSDISLDAYPDIKIKGRVDHIYYESKIVNNVTIYQVDILPDTVPEVFRSGMSATVRIAEDGKNNVLMLPLDAVKRGKAGTYVLLAGGVGNKPVEQKVELGLSDDKNVEILSGIDKNDRVLESVQKYTLSPAAKMGTNPFMPIRRRR